jgi:hypothetical protein
MGDLTTERTPLLIAAEINTIKHQTGKILLNSAMEIGRRLKEAKDMINYGEWGKWLETKVNYSQKTAENLMRIFDAYGSQLTDAANVAASNAAPSSVAAQPLINLNYTQALILLGVPEEDRSQFIADLDLENISTRELQKAVQERNQAITERDRALAEGVGLQKTLTDQEGKITQLINERNGLKAKSEELSKSQTEAANKVERLSMELKSLKQDTSAQAITRMSNNLNAAYYKAKANKIAFLYESMDRNFKDLLKELKEFAAKEPETYEVYKNKIVDFLAQGIKEKM